MKNVTPIQEAELISQLRENAKAFRQITALPEGPVANWTQLQDDIDADDARPDYMQGINIVNNNTLVLRRKVGEHYIPFAYLKKCQEGVIMAKRLANMLRLKLSPFTGRRLDPVTRPFNYNLTMQDAQTDAAFILTQCQDIAQFVAVFVDAYQRLAPPRDKKYISMLRSRPRATGVKTMNEVRAAVAELFSAQTQTIENVTAQLYRSNNELGKIEAFQHTLVNQTAQLVQIKNALEKIEATLAAQAQTIVTANPSEVPNVCVNVPGSPLTTFLQSPDAR